MSEYKWYLTAAMWVAAITLGYVGFGEYFSRHGETRTSWDILYRTLQLFVLNSGALPESVSWPLEVGRFLAPIMTVYTTAQALEFVLRDQLQRFRLRLMRNHVVICGLGRKGLLLAEAFRQSGESVLVIEKNKDNERIERCREIGAVTMVGDTARPEILRKARVGRAKYVISVCGSDSTNAEVAVLARQLSRHRKGKALLCLVHIVDLHLCALLRDCQMQVGREDSFRLEFFNVFESGARTLLDEYISFDQMSDGAGSKARIAVVGLGWLGESVVVNAARRWRDIYEAKRTRLVVSLVDKVALKKKESLSSRYPGLETLCDLTVQQMDTESFEFERANFLFNKEGELDVKAVFVCLDDDSRALAAALKLSQRARGSKVPIVVRMSDEGGLATLLKTDDGSRGPGANLRPFVLLEQTCTPNLIFGCTYETLAREFHERYVRNERSKGSTPHNKPAMVPWEQLSESFRDSNRSEAQHIRIKLEAIGCDLVMTSELNPQVFQFATEEVEVMAKMEHERWMSEKARNGVTYGPERDTGKKTHPNMVAWANLKEVDRDIDRDAVRGIPAMLARAGFLIYRLREQQ